MRCRQCEVELIAEDSRILDNLCDHCNVDLIAQIMVSELSKHKINHDDDVNSEIDLVGGAQTEVIVDEASSVSVIVESLTEEKSVSDQNSVMDELDDDNSATLIIKSPPSPELTSTSAKLSRPSIFNPIDLKSNLLEEVDKSLVIDEVDEDDQMSMKDGSDDERNSQVVDSEKKVVTFERMRTRAKVSQLSSETQKEIKSEAPEEEEKQVENDEVDEEDLKEALARRITRKTRMEIEKYRHPDYEPTNQLAQSRRTKIFKSKTVYKAPTSQARVYSSDYVFHKGLYYQLGDIVGVRDLHGRGIFYAQITGFWTDQYCFKCATIQWLFPTKESPPPIDGFDARTYVLGFLDETPRPLEALMPVMRCPSDYFRFNATPYPTPTPDPNAKNFIWKRMQPVSLNPYIDEI